MDTTSDGTPACATCGDVQTEGHACSATDGRGAGGEPQITIPAELWNTGLFKPAWRRNAAEGVAQTTSLFDPGPARPAAAVDEVDPMDVPEPVEPIDTLETPEEPEEPSEQAPDLTDQDEQDDDVHFVVPPVITPTSPQPTEVRASEPEEADAEATDTDLVDAGPHDAPEDEEPTPVDDQMPLAGDDTATDLFRAGSTDDEAPYEVAEEPEEVEAYDPDATSVHDFGAYPLDEEVADHSPEAFAPAADSFPEPPSLTLVEDDPSQSAYDLYGDHLYADTAPATDAEQEGAENLRDTSLSSLALPSSVPFAPTPRQPRVTSEVPLADEVVEEKGSRRGLWIIAVVLVLVVAGGGWFFWQHQQNAPVRDAFTASNEAFLSASAKLEAAGSIEQVALAGQEFARTADLLTATGDATRERDSDLAVAARRAAVAQSAVADAAAPLADLSTENLAPWSTAREALTTALEGLPEVKDDIESAGGSTSGLPAVSVVEHTQTVIGEEVVSSAGAQVVEQLEQLQAASLLADVRAVGASAGEFVEPLNTAAEGLGDETKAESLAAYATFYQALSGLQGVRPKNLEAWPRTRDAIAEAARALPAGKETAAEVLEATDSLVEKAGTKYEAWQTKHATAKADRAQDLAGTEAAITAVTAADTSLATLRTQLQEFAQGAGSLPADGREGEAFRVLDGAAKAREDLLATLTGLTVPKRAQGELDALVEVVRADAETVRAVAGDAAGCEGSCRLTGKPAWRAMLTQNTDGATAWAEALEAWTPVSEETKERVAKRKLPKRPTI